MSIVQRTRKKVKGAGRCKMHEKTRKPKKTNYKSKKYQKNLDFLSRLYYNEQGLNQGNNILGGYIQCLLL